MSWRSTIAVSPARERGSRPRPPPVGAAPPRAPPRPFRPPGERTPGRGPSSRGPRPGAQRRLEVAGDALAGGGRAAQQEDDGATRRAGSPKERSSFSRRGLRLVRRRLRAGRREGPSPWPRPGRRAPAGGPRASPPRCLRRSLRRRSRARVDAQDARACGDEVRASRGGTHEPEAGAHRGLGHAARRLVLAHVPGSGHRHVDRCPAQAAEERDVGGGQGPSLAEGRRAVGTGDVVARSLPSASASGTGPKRRARLAVSMLFFTSSKKDPVSFWVTPPMSRAAMLAIVPTTETSADHRSSVVPGPRSRGRISLVASTALPGAVPWTFIRAREGGSRSCHSISVTNRARTLPNPTEAVARKRSLGRGPPPIRCRARTRHFPGSVRNRQTISRGAPISTVPSKCR